MTIKEILKLFPNTTKKDWRKHSNGGGWVQKTAIVAKTAYVEKSAIVYENAKVYGTAKIYGNAEVYGKAKILGKAKVFGKARIYRNAQVYGNAQISETAWVSGNAQVSGNARVYGSAWVYGNAQVYGSARVHGNAQIISGKWKNNPLQIYGSRNHITHCAPNKIAIGCEIHTFSEWSRNYKKVGKKYNYSKSEIAEYKNYIDLIIKTQKRIKSRKKK